MSVSTTDDSLVEPNEEFKLTLSNPTDATLNPSDAWAGTIVVTGTIRENDRATVSVSDASATEGDPVSFTVSLSEAAIPKEINPYTAVRYQLEHVTTDPSDFAGPSTSGQLVFVGNETEKTVSVSTTNDSVDEEDEIFTLRLTQPSNLTLGDDTTGTGTIRDDDGSRPLTASFENMPASHDGGAFLFGLTFSEEVELSFRRLRDEAFNVTGGTVRTARRKQPGSNLQWTITVEPDSSGAVTIELPQTLDCGASGAICTDDGRPLSNALSAMVAGSVVSVSDASAPEGGAVEFTVLLAGGSGQPVTVQYATSNGTAESGTDFTAASGTLTFGANETSKTVSVSTTGDSEDEEDETFALTLSSPTNATLGDATATGTIIDDDLPTVSVSDASAPEGGAVDFTVSLSAANGQSVTVQYATSGGTAESGTDFTAASGTLTFGANETSKTVSVPTAASLSPTGRTGDLIDEEDETFTLTLSSPTNATLGDATATGTIVDDDGPPTVSVSDARATEGDEVEFTLTLSEASGKQVTVEYEPYVRGSDTASRDDFETSAGIALIGLIGPVTSATVRVRTTDDTLAEDDETFGLRLTDATNATLGDATATGTIVDDDARPLTASFEDVPASHDGDSAFTFGLTFSDEFPLSFRTLRDEALDVTGGQVGRARRKQQGSNRRWTISVEPNSHGPVTVVLLETTNCQANGAICTDDDRSLSNTLSATVTGPVGISVADASVKEAAGAVVAFAVTLSRSASGRVTVDYATRNRTALAGEDYTAAAGTLTFEAGEATKTVAVAVLDDAHDEGEETFVLALSNASGARLEDREATGTIENADLMPAALLARFGRATAEQVVEHIEERMAAPRERGFRARFAGRELRPGMERNVAHGLLSQFGQPMGAGAAPMGAHIPGAGIGSLGMAGQDLRMGGRAAMPGGPNGGGFFGSQLPGDDLFSDSEFELNRELVAAT